MQESNIILNAFAVLTGFFLLTYCADLLVTGSVVLAYKVGVSPLFVGLTVVALGTSLPELVVSIHASIIQNSGIAIGNVVGSNIFNAACILGISALIKPISCNKSIIRRDVPVMILVSLISWYMAKDLIISRIEGIILLLTAFIYTYISYTYARKSDDIQQLEEQNSQNNITLSKSLVFIALGGVGLIAGSKLLLHGAIDIARFFKVSEEVIGLTLIACGTSLPELATSAVAAWKGEPEIALGNVIGSNIMNILVILGAAATIYPLTTSQLIFGIDIPIMVTVSLGCLPIMKTGMKIIRAEGALLLFIYIVYIYMLTQR